MVDEVLLSSLRTGGYVIRGSCTQRNACNATWEINIDQVIHTVGDVTLTELRENMRCPQCNAAITTTLTSLK
jgi:hypothetical protein